MRCLVIVLVYFVCGGLRADDFSGWKPFQQPAAKVESVNGGVVLQGSEWSCLAAAEPLSDCEFEVTLSVESVATQ